MQWISAVRDYHLTKKLPFGIRFTAPHHSRPKLAYRCMSDMHTRQSETEAASRRSRSQEDECWSQVKDLVRGIGAETTPIKSSACGTKIH
ncbi:unnamed protein product [Acanthoscelides obtectus]|uniref:Uncharacterized protein n=1 Tax=Acanthoscelides obtectus TaxID=200917 RepID=A0A9P0Q0W2_ACAOB|nr:unnamed protein product [Acanthoscelides obtectus]CAH2020346.1 unnamed protein product [Acanthoscelides obtectus]CAK1682209.1 hypothetical protein AOBTE_LOCUS33486 [Acanthoscelides obtectus]CAK1683640.1 hypothetical protein AOBTE_LOCUS34374 [Acanthoscelides obtectus]